MSDPRRCSARGFKRRRYNQTISRRGRDLVYTASHTAVTRDDLDTNGGGDGVIQNTVTADSNETAPVSANAAVAVDQRPDLTFTKTADVSSVDAAGDVISYTITVENSGNVTQVIQSVTDSNVNIVTPVTDQNAPILGPFQLGQILVDEFNIGDTNQDGVQDPGETFQYAIVGDENFNGIQDPGETFVLTNVGDTNQNGNQDLGETLIQCQTPL